MRLIEEPYAVAPHVRFCEGRCNIRLLDFLLLCIKTKKLEIRLKQLTKILLKILSSKRLAFTIASETKRSPR